MGDFERNRCRGGRAGFSDRLKSSGFEFSFLGKGETPPPKKIVLQECVPTFFLRLKKIRFAN